MKSPTFQCPIIYFARSIRFVENKKTYRIRLLYYFYVILTLHYVLFFFFCEKSLFLAQRTSIIIQIYSLILTIYLIDDKMYQRFVLFLSIELRKVKILLDRRIAHYGVTTNIGSVLKFVIQFF